MGETWVRAGSRQGVQARTRTADAHPSVIADERLSNEMHRAASDGGSRIRRRPFPVVAVV